FQEALAKEIHRHQRTGHQFVLAMLDIDFFKRFNDTFGHPVGDEILKGLVDELLTNVRDMDVVARYGGEEFAIIFPETRGVAARLCQLGYRGTDHVGKYDDPSPTSYGVVAMMKNGDGPVVIVRSDMDALPVLEQTGLPYASTARAKSPSGDDVAVMHACGHDI